MLKYALLALLAARPRHGYDLRLAFERLLGGTWPLNAGQVYTTLSRLERDGLVESEREAGEQAPDRKVFTLTEDGRLALKRWLSEPVAEPAHLKGELFTKVLAQALVGRGDGRSLVGRQREHLLRSMAQLRRLGQDDELAPATVLLVEGAVLHLEADLKWLDLVEERLGEVSHE